MSHLSKLFVNELPTDAAKQTSKNNILKSLIYILSKTFCHTQ